MKIDEGAEHSWTVALLNDCVEILDDASLAAANLTIPARVSDFLANMAVGDSMPFDSYFSDELPNKASRDDLLKGLSDQTKLVDGYVDVDARTITKVSGSGAARIRPFVVAAVIAAIAIGVLVAMNHWDQAPGMPDRSKRVAASVLIGDLIVVWIGMIAHVAMSWYKGFRDRGSAVPRSARRVLYLVSARELSIWVAVVIGAVLTYAFAATGQTTEAVALFAIGYSADSVIDAFVPRLDARLVEIATTIATVPK
jgi:hypothetical protein